MKFLWIILLVVLFTILAEMLRRKTINKLCKDLYNAAYQKKDEELFLLLIDSPQAKMLMSDASRGLMKLNYFISSDQETKAIHLINKLKKRKLDKNNQKAFYSLSIGYTSEKQNEIATELLEDLKIKAENTKDQEWILLYLDSQLLVDIYIKKELTKAEALEEIIHSDLDNNSKVIYMIRLARLYDLNNMKDLSREWLMKADRIAEGQAKKKVASLLKKGWDSR